jgi:transglutaminase-like putative cysteine protease
MIKLLIMILLISTLPVQAKGYKSPSEMIQSDHPIIMDLASAITAAKRTPMDKSRAIHDWVALNISFDGEAAHKRTSGIIEYSKQDAVSVLMLNLAVCEGYSQLVAALHRAVGIPAKVVMGQFAYFSYKSFPYIKRSNHLPDLNAINFLHAWNEVYIGGKWIPMDTTTDAGGWDGKAWVKNPTIVREFFNPDLEYFQATHRVMDVFDR